MIVAAVVVAGAKASGDSYPSLCGIGYSQSPISLQRCQDNNGHENRFMNPIEREEISIGFGTVKSMVELISLDGGKALRITPNDDTGGTFSVEAHGSKKEYKLRYCLVHRNSDHTIELSSESNGQYPAEIQCFGDMTGGTDDHPVHRMGALSVLLVNGETEDADGNKEETDSGFIGQLKDKIMPIAPFKTSDVDFGFGGIAGSAGLTRYWTYSGSERLAPCAENVDWYVLYDPAGISNAQLDMLTDAGVSAPAKHMAHHNGRHPDGCPVYHSGASSIGAMVTLLALVLLQA